MQLTQRYKYYMDLAIVRSYANGKIIKDKIDTRFCLGSKIKKSCQDKGLIILPLARQRFLSVLMDHWEGITQQVYGSA